jgi:ketosteroid isomerase-like protein
MGSNAAEWTTEQINVGVARRAWSFFYLHSSLRGHEGGGDNTLFHLVADDVVWIHEGPHHPGLPYYPGELHGKEAMMEMVQSEDGVIGDLDLEDPIGSPLEFYATGDRVVMINEERYTVVKTGVTVRHNRNAVVMDFRDGLIVRFRIIANLNDYIESRLGPGWSAQVITPG